jgi:hypothetical protein
VGIGLELGLEDVLTRERLKDLLKDLSGIQFGVDSAYSVFNKEHSNDGTLTFYVPAPKSVSGSFSKGNKKKPRKQCGQLINKALTIELSSEDIEDARKCIEAREQLGWPEKYAAHKQAMLRNDAKRNLWDEYASRPDVVAAMPSGLLGRASPTPEEKAEGIRRNTYGRRGGR